MFLVLLTAAAAILGGVVAVVMGRGGEIAWFARDLPAVRFRLRTPSDVAMLRLPTGLFGFQEHATGEALREIAQLLAERDAEIARLRDDVRQLGTPSIPGPASRDGLTAEAADTADPVDTGTVGPDGLARSQT